MVSAERFFLKYAFPCAHVLLDRKTLTRERYNELEDGLRTGELPSRDVIEESFPPAFRRIRKLAGEMGIRDYWDIQVLEKYWYENHNENIDDRDGGYFGMPEFFCDFCKVHDAEVVKIFDNGFVLAKYGDKKRPVTVEYISDIKTGDRIRIHHAYAVERIE